MFDYIVPSDFKVYKAMNEDSDEKDDTLPNSENRYAQKEYDYTYIVPIDLNFMFNTENLFGVIN